MLSPRNPVIPGTPDHESLVVISELSDQFWENGRV